MKASLKIVFFFAALAASTGVFSQKKVFHENGKVAYDSTFHTFYYSSGARLFNPAFSTVYYENEKTAYKSDYKNIYYSNGSIAYNAMNKNIYYSNGNLAYDSRTRTAFSNGNEKQNLDKNSDGGYTIKEEGLKVAIDKNNKYVFELVLQDVGFFYVTDFKTYFSMMSGTLADAKTVVKYQF